MEPVINRADWWVILSLLLVGGSWVLPRLLFGKGRSIKRRDLKPWILASLFAAAVYAVVCHGIKTYPGLGWLLIVIGLVNLFACMSVYVTRLSASTAVDGTLQLNRWIYLSLLIVLVWVVGLLVVSRSAESRTYRQFLAGLNSRLKNHNRAFLPSSLQRDSDPNVNGWRLSCYYETEPFIIGQNAWNDKLCSEIRQRGFHKSVRNLILARESSATRIVNREKMRDLHDLCAFEKEKYEARTNEERRPHHRRPEPPGMGRPPAGPPGPAGPPRPEHRPDSPPPTARRR
jgi:hypothetical protein